MCLDECEWNWSCHLQLKILVLFKKAKFYFNEVSNDCWWSFRWPGYLKPFHGPMVPLYQMLCNGHQRAKRVAEQHSTRAKLCMNYCHSEHICCICAHSRQRMNMVSIRNTFWIKYYDIDSQCKSKTKKINRKHRDRTGINLRSTWAEEFQMEDFIHIIFLTVWSSCNAVLEVLLSTKPPITGCFSLYYQLISLCIHMHLYTLRTRYRRGITLLYLDATLIYMMNYGVPSFSHVQMYMYQVAPGRFMSVLLPHYTCPQQLCGLRPWSAIIWKSHQCGV